MTDNEIKTEVKKAVDLYLENEYEIKDLYNHVLQVIRENSDPGMKHIIQLECLVFKVQELRTSQRLFWAGHKSKLTVCKTQETALDKQIQYLLTISGYSIDRYKNIPKQNSLFK